MNGRVFAVNRSPVLAWNPQLQVPYPDMPAAAAISPVVAPSDPYGRCWQNQVEAGTNFPYFGALYNNSLPPTAYRLQPGCMANIGQFWPPTPPPEGCGRYDSSNLYFGPPVLRHTENISSNIRSSFPSLGHYSHVVDTQKDQSQRMFKRETPISPNVSAPSISICSSTSKSDNLNSCCIIDSNLKTQNSHSHNLSKPELLTVPSGHDPHMCAPDLRSNSSTMHPSIDKSCFSPSHTQKNSMGFHSSPQDGVQKAKYCSANQENCTASPLKNVYFSHFESENVNSMLNKNFSKPSERHLECDQRNGLSFASKSKHVPQPPVSGYFSNYSPKKFDFPNRLELQKTSAPTPSTIMHDRDSVVLLNEHYKHRSGSHRVKTEKTTAPDCKYQKSGPNNTPMHVQGPEFRGSDVFNVPTSVLHSKIEPSDKYFLPNCSSTTPNCIATSYASPGPYLMTKDVSADLRTAVSYENSLYQNPCSLRKTWHYTELPPMGAENCFGSPEPAKPPPGNLPRATSALSEGCISVAQTAPQGIEIVKATGTSLHLDIAPPSALSKKRKVTEMDDDVQIIGVQTKLAKHESRSTSKKVLMPTPVIVPEPLCLKSEKEPEVLEAHHDFEFEKNSETKSPPVLTCEAEVLDVKPFAVLEAYHQGAAIAECSSDIPNLECNLPVSPCPLVSIKKESSSEDELLPRDLNVTEKMSDIPDCQDLKRTSLGSPLDIKIKVEDGHGEKAEISYNENHGLNLLLNTIEQMSFQKIEAPNSPVCSPKEDVCEEPSKKDSAGIRGIDLLSVIAEQRLVSEFDDVKPEVEDIPSIKSNYPEMKENKGLADDEQVKSAPEAVAVSSKSSVSEIQDRIVELRRKYKQKQKELSRLKPKRRIVTSYMKDMQKSVKDVSTSSSSINSLVQEVQSGSSDDQGRQNSSDSPDEVDLKNAKLESKCAISRIKRNARVVKKQLQEVMDRRITRKSLEISKLSEKDSSASEQSKNMKSPSKSKDCRPKRGVESTANCTSSKPSALTKGNLRKHCLPERGKSCKAYSLRQSSQSKSESAESNSISRTISSKRKSDNPKKYVPSKQNKQSETIIAKHLRSRILFEVSGCTSDEESTKDGVPDDLYDALIKCHLNEESKCGSKLMANSDSEINENGILAYPEPSLLCPEHLVERQRLLALEDGLFYAGYIKECQDPQKYGIALDGQRGNRLHMFTREELLTQAIVESKPLTSELLEGTRVCAYWSQQYRCLYPGVVGKAPGPSADWSEPRVFVQFDDGDAGQIPTKNVRLIPPDIIPIESISRSDPLNNSIRQRSSSRGPLRPLKCSTPKRLISKHRDTSNEHESKESSCASINESSCDDSCFVDLSRSPSHPPDGSAAASVAFGPGSSADPEKKSRKGRSKHRPSHRADPEPAAEGRSEAKTKRHKKYKEKHRRHHHHHRRHHHHHHHHHHSKKRKHRRKSEKGSAVGADPASEQHSSAEHLPQSEPNRVC